MTEKTYSLGQKKAPRVPLLFAVGDLGVGLYQRQITELERHLGAFKEMKELAVKAIPEMKNPLSGVMLIR